jgi:hypothetical protein
MQMQGVKCHAGNSDHDVAAFRNMFDTTILHDSVQGRVTSARSSIPNELTNLPADLRRCC